jgi:gamma-glutamylcyclotransferase (GGCT)/AIG2-like uncharacterized protein YtfP
MSHNVFTYGTLMFPKVWEYVVQGQYASQKARIAGFERFAVIDQDFPAVVPAENNRHVSGVLYLNVSPEDMFRLDEYESHIYHRKTVNLLEPVALQAEVYVLNPEFSHVVGSEPWDEQAFLKKLEQW